MDESIDSEEELYTACGPGDRRIIDWYFSTGKTKINTYFKNGFTVLHFAVQNNNLDLVEFFLKNGADVNIKDLTEEETSLCIAIHLVLPKMVQILLYHGASLFNVRKSNSALWMALSHIVKFMHDPHESDLMFKMDDQIINMILEYGVKSEDENVSNYYKLCLAIIDDDIETVKDLADVTVEDINFSTVRAENPLAIAVLLNRLTITELLLMRGADPNQGQTPERHSTLITAITQKNLAMLKLLLRFSASVNFVASSDTFYGFDRTPLYLAIYNLASEDDDTCLEMMELLVDHGAEVDGSSIRRGIAGRTALHRICSKGNLAAAKFLVQHSIDVNSRDAEDNTALHKSYKYPGIVRLLLENGAEVNAANCLGQTPMHLACAFGPLESVELLAKFRASLRTVDRRSASILHYAAKNGEDVINFVSDLAVNRGMISVNVRDDGGETPLHWAMCCESVVALLQRGADFNLASNRGLYPTHLCLRCTVIHYLLRLGALGYESRISCAGIDDAGSLREIYDWELDRLRNEIIGWNPKMTLYDLFFIDRGSAVRFAGNKNLVKAFTDCRNNFESKYPYFGKLMNSLYWRCLNRKNWVDAAKDQLNEICGLVLPDIQEEMIFSFLNDSQLKIFIAKE